MALDAYEQMFAKMDLHATTMLPGLQGHAPITGHPELQAYRHAYSARTILPLLREQGITTENDGDLASKICATYWLTLNAALAVARDFGENTITPDAMAQIEKAGHVNDRLRGDAGERHETVATCIFRAIERNWSHEDTNFPVQVLSDLLGIPPVPPTPHPFNRTDSEIVRRRNWHDGATAMLQATALYDQQKDDEFAVQVNASAGHYVKNSVLEMAAANNPDSVLDDDTAQLLTDAYTAALARGRLLTAHPAEQPMLQHLSDGFYEREGRTQQLTPLMLSQFDRLYFAAAITERVIAATGANDTQADELQAHVYNAFGMTGNGDTPQPDRSQPVKGKRYH